MLWYNIPLTRDYFPVAPCREKGKSKKYEGNRIGRACQLPGNAVKLLKKMKGRVAARL
jgi:hypothetical protein